MKLRIKSWHPNPVVFPIVVERLNSSRLRVTETVGTFSIDPGEREYSDVPANVLAAIRTHHEPGGLMRITSQGAATQ